MFVGKGCIYADVHWHYPRPHDIWTNMSVHCTKEPRSRSMELWALGHTAAIFRLTMQTYIVYMRLVGVDPGRLETTPRMHVVQTSGALT